MADEIEDYFRNAVRLQALVHAGKLICRNCSDPVDGNYEFCGMCREMGCPMTPALPSSEGKV